MSPLSGKERSQRYLARKRGEDVPMGRPGYAAAPVLGRFMAKVDKVDNGCWEWLGARTAKGYGKFSFDGRMIVAHRMAYELLRGAIPEGLEIDHTCTNRGCVNPFHMEPVTHQVNLQRRARRTHCKRGHEFTEANTYVDPQRGAHVCRTCRNARKRARKASR